MSKRYFAYVTCNSALFVREHSYFDDLEDAIHFAEVNAKAWDGYWAVTDTTKVEDKTVANGNFLKEAV